MDHERLGEPPEREGRTSQGKHLCKVVVSELIWTPALEPLHSLAAVLYAEDLWRRPAELRAELADAQALIVRNQTQVTGELPAAAPGSTVSPPGARPLIAQYGGERAAALPVVTDGRTVGYLLARTTRGAALPTAAERFLATLNRTFLADRAPDPRACAGPKPAGRPRAHGTPRPVGRGGTARRRRAAWQARASRGVGGGTNSCRCQMMADIAHELRTPLPVLQGNLRAMLDDIYPLSKDEVATVCEASLGLRRLVDGLHELRTQPVAVAPTLAFEVTDTGAGIAANELPHVFERF